MIRLFAALPIPDDVAESLARRQQGLPRAKWRPLDTLHLTLRFFGEMTEDKAADLDVELDQIHVEPFDYVLSGAIRSQVDGGKVQVFQAGESFSESPGARHDLSENASETEPAKLLAIFVVDSTDTALTTMDAK